MNASDVPKQGRLDALRPYLTKYKCFPPGVDPVMAAIGMEELKVRASSATVRHGIGRRRKERKRREEIGRK